MPFSTLHQIFFSPAGSTRQVADTLARHGKTAVKTYDLLRHPLTCDVLCAPDDLAVVALPVYSGRLPEPCLASLARFKGQGTLAVAVVVYGNRAYDDALLELSDQLLATGFNLLGAAAVVARHSIFPSVAAGRPNVEDKRRLAHFMGRCLHKAVTFDPARPWPPLTIPGTRPYKDPKVSTLKPSTNERCASCGTCVRLCPTGALTLSGNTLLRDDAKCMTCTSCIAACPSSAQAFQGTGYAAMNQTFASNFSAACEPDFFV